MAYMRDKDNVRLDSLAVPDRTEVAAAQANALAALEAASAAGSSLLYGDRIDLAAPLGWWTLNESGATIPDSSGNGHDMTLTGSPAVAAAVAPTLGPSRAFGTGKYGQIPYFAGLNFAGAFTVEAWIRSFSPTVSGQMIVARRSTGANLWTLRLSTGGLPEFGSSGVGLPAPSLPTTDSVHVVGVCTPGGRQKLYVNGEEVADTAAAGSLTTSASVGLAVGVQYTDSFAAGAFDGRISQVAVYAKALTARQIASHYTTGLTEVSAITPPVVTAPSVGTGFTVPTWGSAPRAVAQYGRTDLTGHIERGTADIAPGAVLLTGGSWTSGRDVVVQSDTGTVVLTSTATTLVVSQILTGSAPSWVSLDGAQL